MPVHVCKLCDDKLMNPMFGWNIPLFIIDTGHKKKNFFKQT